MLLLYSQQAKDKERRMRMREEKLEEQRLHQEERLRKALERAQADPKKRVSIVGAPSLTLFRLFVA